MKNCETFFDIAIRRSKKPDIYSIGQRFFSKNWRFSTRLR